MLPNTVVRLQVFGGLMLEATQRIRSCDCTICGSLIPVLSMTRWSKASWATKLLTSRSRSSRRVQQIQPFCILRASVQPACSAENNANIHSASDVCRAPAGKLYCSGPTCTKWVRLISAASMFSSAMSLTMTATFKFALLARICCNSVVFPAPKNPLSSVTGSGLSCIAMFNARRSG